MGNIMKICQRFIQCHVVLASTELCILQMLGQYSHSRQGCKLVQLRCTTKIQMGGSYFCDKLLMHYNHAFDGVLHTFVHET